MAEKKTYDIAAYIWPSYTGDEPRTRIFWEEGYGEWQTVKNVEKNSAKKLDWYLENWTNRKPLWGYVNEANADVMQMQIECATSYGVNVFIYDWYWYDKRPFLENCLNDGFLKAKNNDKMKFYLMWANHDVTYLWDVRNSSDCKTVMWYASVGMDEYKQLVERFITKYFSHPSYYKVNGCPAFMIYDTQNFVKSFGSVEGARAALNYFREEVKRAGFPDLHLQFTARSDAARNYSGVDTPVKENGVHEKLGADALTHYQWAHFAKPDGEYSEWAKAAKAEYAKMDERGIPYFPHVSLGWDNNPRFTGFREGVIKNATPEKIEEALRVAKDYVDTHELPVPLITVNSWNEWTETSYLEPDTLYGYGYLETIKKIFVDGE